MLSFFRRLDVQDRRQTPERGPFGPCLEGLEDRLLLYSTLGGHFVYGSRITYSFMPDGTSVGGTPSALYQTLNAKFSTATWQLQFQKAAAVWQAYANVNLVPGFRQRQPGIVQRQPAGRLRGSATSGSG